MGLLQEEDIVQSASSGTLLKELGFRLWDAIRHPVRTVRALATRVNPDPTESSEPSREPTPEPEPTLKPEPEPTPEPEPKPEEPEEPEAVPEKSSLCLALEGVSETLYTNLPGVQAAPGVNVPQYAIVLDHDGEAQIKEQKACDVFSSFGTNNDLLSWLFTPKEQGKYQLYALDYPNWIKLSRVGEFVRTKIYRAENEEDNLSYYIVTNCAYAKGGFQTDSMVASEIRDRLAARNDLTAPPSTEAPKAANE